MASAGSVTVDFDARSARFAAELEMVQGILKRLEGSASSLAKGLKLIPALFAAEAAGRVLGYAKAMFEAADAIGDVAARSGIAVESLSRLKFIAGQSDVEFSSLTTGIKQFQKNLSDATNGSSSAARSFAQVGVQATKIRNLSFEDLRQTIAKGFADVRNPADRTRIAMELFGEAGDQLVPFLNQGLEGLQRLGKEADRLGIALEAQMVVAIGAADQALKKLRATVDRFLQRDLGRLALFIVGTDALYARSATKWLSLRKGCEC